MGTDRDSRTNSFSRREFKMKLTRILPKFLAKTYQEEDLRRTKIQLEYYQGLVRNLEYRIEEGRAELDRLRRNK